MCIRMTYNTIYRVWPLGVNRSVTAIQFQNKSVDFTKLFPSVKYYSVDPGELTIGRVAAALSLYHQKRAFRDLLAVSIMIKIRTKYSMT